MIRIVTLAEISRAAEWAVRSGREILCFAGSTAVQKAPGGAEHIIKLTGRTSLGTTGGLTRIKNAAAFDIPVLRTSSIVERSGSQVRYFAQVQKSAVSDVSHDSYAPGPGDHVRPGMVQTIDGKVYTHYYRISAELAALIRKGEEEHLADVKRAWELTYKLVRDQVNAMAAKRYGPASTADGAEKLAKADLARRLPKELAGGPSKWEAVLDRLLLLTQKRDTEGCHSIGTDPPITEGNRIIHVVSTTPKTKVGKIPSSQVVNY